jgi:periplasmic divalent cation tolerance protein
MKTDLQIVLCTVPDRERAEQIAGVLVAESLAACVNIVADITSVYRWKGAIEHDPELLLIIKTGEAQFAALQNRIRELHPYELPEVVAVTIRDGLPAYLDWMTTSLANPR